MKVITKIQFKIVNEFVIMSEVSHPSLANI